MNGHDDSAVAVKPDESVVAPSNIPPSNKMAEIITTLTNVEISISYRLHSYSHIHVMGVAWHKHNVNVF